MNYALYMQHITRFQTGLAVGMECSRSVSNFQYQLAIKVGQPWIIHL